MTVILSLIPFLFFLYDSAAQSADRGQSDGRDVHVGQADLATTEQGRHPVLYDIAQAQVRVPVAGRHQRRGDHVLHDSPAEPVHPVRVHHLGRKRIRSRAAVAARGRHHRRIR